MRDMGAEFVRVDDVWVKFLKPGTLSISQPRKQYNPAEKVNTSSEHVDSLTEEQRAWAAEKERMAFSDDVGLDESDKAELAKQAAANEPVHDTMEWFKQTAVPQVAD